MRDVLASLPPPPSDAPARPSEELLAEGKRCFAAGDTASAVECFQDACAQLWVALGSAARLSTLQPLRRHPSPLPLQGCHSRPGC